MCNFGEKNFNIGTFSKKIGFFPEIEIFETKPEGTSQSDLVQELSSQSGKILEICFIQNNQLVEKIASKMYVKNNEFGLYDSETKNFIHFIRPYREW